MDSKQVAKFLENIPQEGIVAIIGCMDRRLVRTFELFGDTTMPTADKLEKLAALYNVHGDTYNALYAILEKLNPDRIKIFANAGANVSALATDIAKEGTVAGVLVVCHTGCGGMNVTATALAKGAKEEHDEFFRHLGGSRYANAYDGSKPSSEMSIEKIVEKVQSNAEKLNPGIQEKSAAKFSKNVLALLVDINDVNLEEEGHARWLVVADPDVGEYPSYFENTPRDQTYGIIGSRESTAIDVRIAKEVIGVEKVVDKRAK